MNVQPLQIGSVRTTTNLVLAPMSGVTDSAFRRMVKHCSGESVGLLVSEFVAAEGLTRDNAKTLRMLRYLESERPISIQIFGADVDRMVRAARMVEDAGADVVDINCGCPAPKVVKRGGGAQLLRDPDRLAEIVREIVRAVRIPVTAKIRSGWDHSSLNAVEIAHRIESEGASMLAVHGRTRLQLYSGQADWDVVAAIRASLGIPVLGSGDVTTPERAATLLGRGAADGVMIGRAAMSNPWIFAQVADAAAGRPPSTPDGAALIDVLTVFRDALRETLPDHAFIGRYRGIACHFVKGMRGSAAARAAIGAVKTVEEIAAIFADFVLGDAGVPLRRVAAG